MALLCDVTTSDDIVVSDAYIRPRFEVRKKIDEEDVKTSYLFVECEVYQSQALANAHGSRTLQVLDVDRFKGAWDSEGGGLEVQGYALMKAQPALADATDV
jgi:hypothetical protein|tara:strand:+ start:611 stop:913 length:303 start_codon:yes stop_codon:yes gene_type:complete